MVKKYQVIISGRAQKSLNWIINYIAETVSDKVAIKVEKGLLETALNLTTLPNRIRSYAVQKKDWYIVMFQSGRTKLSLP